MSLDMLRAMFARPNPVADAPIAHGAGVPPGGKSWPALSEKDRDTLIRTLFGEAAFEPEAGQIAVVHVIRNRLLRGPARRFGGTPAGVCKKPWQFSCWNPNDPQLPRLLALDPDGPMYLSLGQVVDRAWALPDSVGGADHYYASYIARPSWAVPPARETARHGVHRFYADVP